MYHRPVTFFILFSIFLAVCFGFSLAIAAPNLISFQTQTLYLESKNVFPDSRSLNTIHVVFKSGKDLSQAELVSSRCNIHSELQKIQGKTYAYSVKFFHDTSCKSGSIHIMHEGEIEHTIDVNIITEASIFETFTDYSDIKLQKIFTLMKRKVSKYEQNFDITQEFTVETSKQQRRWNELNYSKNIVENIISKRAQKYLVPVDGYDIGHSHAPNRIPNAGRPYRAGYTDGIHHGWDVGSKFGEEVISIDDGVVVRVVPEFEWSDFDRIVHGNSLTEEQKVKNLDILRGKQVWVKTSRGDIVLYSHLDDIYTHIVEGAVVRRGSPIGTIGATGVPDKNYTNYHLHFAIHKNPYNHSTAGTYGFDDYLHWDWYYKGLSLHEVLEKQSELFE